LTIIDFLKHADAPARTKAGLAESNAANAKYPSVLEGSVIAAIARSCLRDCFFGRRVAVPDAALGIVCRDVVVTRWRPRNASPGKTRSGLWLSRPLPGGPA